MLQTNQCHFTQTFATFRYPERQSAEHMTLNLKKDDTLLYHIHISHPTDDYFGAVREENLKTIPPKLHHVYRMGYHILYKV